MNKLKEKYTEIERVDIMEKSYISLHENQNYDDNDLKFQEGLERRYQDFAKSYLKDYEETQRMKQQDYQDYLDDLYDTDRPPVLGGSFLENW